MADHDPHQTVLALAEAIGPATALLARRLFYRATRETCQHCLELLSYARSFTPSRVERAALRLMDYGTLDVDALRFLLEQDLDGLAHRPETEFDGQLSLGLTDAPIISARVKSRFP